jgi:nicotinamidase-related amidase
MSDALLVIDVQESFRHTPYWRTDDLEAFLAAQNKLIAGARQAGIPVVRIFHVQDDDGPFSRMRGWIVPLAGSDSVSDFVVEKNVHGALVQSGLHEWLTEHGIQRLIISGIRTEQCCETTTRHASDLGYQIDFVTEATLTFPMRHANGNIYSPDEIKEKTELVLAGRFARICTVDDVLSRLAVTV